MLLERLLENVGLDVDAFATCRVATGWRLRLPALDQVTFHYAVEGEGAVVGGGPTPLALVGGHLAVVPPHLVHTLQCGAPPFGEAAVGGGSLSSSELPAHVAGPAEEGGLVVACGRVNVTYGGSLGLFDRLSEVLVLDFSDTPGMRSTFASILDEMRSARPGSRAMTSALMKECLIRVFRRICEDDDCALPWLTAVDDPALSPALEAMLGNPEDPHTVATLAARAHMSRSVFARRFRETFGVPPLEYLRGVRLRHAAALLRNSGSLPVAVVAERSGFASRSQFSRAFKAYFGCAPSEFRG